MTIDNTRMIELQTQGLWPEWLPRDYNELYTQYGAFVIHLVRKHNKVDVDPRDLINHIWTKLLENDVLTKYVDAATSEYPEMVTTDQACEFLGLPLKTFTLIALGRRCYERFLPSPVNGKKYTSTKALWNRKDIIKIRASGYFRPKQKRVPLPQTDTVTVAEAMDYFGIVNFTTFCNYFWSAKKGYPSACLDPVYADLGPLTPANQGIDDHDIEFALWKFEDLIALHEIIDNRTQGQKDAPKAKTPKARVTKSHFSGYLAQAIHNHFVNYCRTRTRRHQERPGDCFPVLRPISDDPTSWEDRLPEDNDQFEGRVEILHLTNRIRKALPGREAEILSFMENGYSLKEAIERLDGLTNAHKRVVTETLEVLRRRIQVMS